MKMWFYITTFYLKVELSFIYHEFYVYISMYARTVFHEDTNIKRVHCNYISP